MMALLRATFKRDRGFGQDLKCATDFWWSSIDLVQSWCADAVCCQSPESGTEQWDWAVGQGCFSWLRKKMTSCKTQQHLAVPENVSSGSSSMKAAVSKGWLEIFPDIWNPNIILSQMWWQQTRWGHKIMWINLHQFKHKYKQSLLGSYKKNWTANFVL